MCSPDCLSHSHPRSSTSSSPPPPPPPPPQPTSSSPQPTPSPPPPHATQPPASAECCSPVHKRRRVDAHLACDTSVPPAMSSPSRQLQDAVRHIMTTESSPRRRQAAISGLFFKRNAALIAKHEPEPEPMHHLESFPGMGAPSQCAHYQRNCWILAECCQRYYPCRRCHDEQQSHEIDRYATKFVACVKCGDAHQPVASHCRSCNVRFAHYFCDVCKFYDDTPGRHAYHCDGCGMCRVGKGLGIDNYHCNGCSNCIPIAFKEKHPCRERSLDANCPICTEYLATSTDPMVFLRCGHTMHANCLKELAASGYTCPICNKSMADMTKWYKQLDEQIKNEVVPREFMYKRSLVLCHECNEKTQVRFHLVHHKCAACGSYNTRLLRHFDVAPCDEAASAAAAAAAAAPSLTADGLVRTDRAVEEATST